MNIGVIVPFYQSQLTQDEQTSVRHLRHYLGGLPLIAVQPAGLGLRLLGFDLCEFPTQHFTSVSAYSQLLLSTTFYTAFSEYDFILIYQTDCLVFLDDLSQWSTAGYDYIGAPWFMDEDNPAAGFSRVGNGGFSLRRVQAFLDVLHSDRYSRHPVSWLEDLKKPVYEYRQQTNPVKRLINRLRVLRSVRRGVKWYTTNYALNEDRFWSDRALFFNPNFRVAPVSTGLQFSFERHPRYCFEQNGHKLPFGCHAWGKWDRAFWETYL